MWPVGAGKELQVQNICTCTARAQYTPAPFFIRRQVGLAMVHPCTEFGVASSKFTFTGGPHVKTASSPLARATCTPQERHPQWILCRQSMHVTCEFGISGASRLTCRCVRIFKCANHLHVHCTCTMHPSPFLHTAPSRPCQGAPMYRVWCRKLKVPFHRRTPRQKHYPPASRAAYTPQERHPQWILSW